ncbi:RluA family pseudouridine synthase [Treponema sp.]|uniref:RluA family pseudouridine synthase n=1 Tax=Treponema sp. TaxID=166 RepID=UPI0025E52E33|nr:RluA family pseudouridine synthase [Treponema sp.]MBR4321971.1 RluA family pseudouridine synthase [Treponema sp.]
MDFKTFKAGKDDDGRRLDKVLRRFLSGENLSSLYKSLRKGLIKVNGKKCPGEFRLSEGDEIKVVDFLLPPQVLANEKNESYSPRESSEKESKFIESITIFKNESLLILNKPYDIPVQPSSSSKGASLAEIVQKDYEISHKNTSLSFRTGPLHRLDRKTTGLIAFSQNLEGAKWFSEKIKSHEIQKVYLALLEGKLTEKAVWEENIQKVESGKLKVENGKRKVESFSFGKVSGFGEGFSCGEDSCFKEAGNFETKTLQGAFQTVSVSSGGDGKAAYTEVTPISHGIFNKKSVTLARILIKTGRTHQIRAQASFHGFPLLGDTAYGGQKIDAKRFGQEFFLHAAELHFPKDNPLGLAESITAPIPQSFEKLLAQLTLKKVL